MFWWHNRAGHLQTCNEVSGWEGRSSCWRGRARREGLEVQTQESAYSGEGSGACVAALTQRRDEQGHMSASLCWKITQHRWMSAPCPPRAGQSGGGRGTSYREARCGLGGRGWRRRWAGDQKEEVSSPGACRPSTLCLVRLCPVDYQILCGHQAPGFVIDIHTGKPLGEWPCPPARSPRSLCPQSPGRSLPCTPTSCPQTSNSPDRARSPVVKHCLLF